MGWSAANKAMAPMAEDGQHTVCNTSASCAVCVWSLARRCTHARAPTSFLKWLAWLRKWGSRVGISWLPATQMCMMPLRAPNPTPPPPPPSHGGSTGICQLSTPTTALQIVDYAEQRAVAAAAAGEAPEGAPGAGGGADGAGAGPSSGGGEAGSSSGSSARDYVAALKPMQVRARARVCSCARHARCVCVCTCMLQLRGWLAAWLPPGAGAGARPAVLVLQVTT